MAKEKEKQKEKPQRNSYIKEKFPISYLPKVWKRKGKARKEKAERSRYKDDIPDVLFQSCMSKVRNTGISSFYLAFSI